MTISTLTTDQQKVHKNLLARIYLFLQKNQLIKEGYDFFILLINMEE